MSDRPLHYAKPDLLSPRQRDVLDRVARGMTNAEIADDLGIGFESVKSHVSEILLKLNVETREQAVVAWRERRRAGPRIRDLARAAMSAGWLKLAVGTGVVAAVGAVAIAFVLAGDSTDNAASDTEATPVPTVEAVQGDPLPFTPQYEGLLSLAPMSAAFPEDESVIVSVGSPGKAGVADLYRYRQDASDVVSISAVRPPSLEEPGTFHRHAWVSDDTQTILSITCRGECYIEAPIPAPTPAELWRSNDGGVTWSLVGEVPSTSLVWGETEDGRAIIEYSDGGVGRYMLVPGNAPLTPPTSIDAKRLVMDPILGPAWMEDRNAMVTGKVIALDGRERVLRQPREPGPDGQLLRFTFQAFLADGSALWTATEAGPRTLIRTMNPNGDPIASVSWDGMLTHFVPLDDGTVIAWAQSEELRRYMDLDSLPAVTSVAIDFAGRTISVLYPLTPDRGGACGQTAKTRYVSPIAASY